MNFARSPEHWDPLTSRLSSGNDGQASFQDYYPSDFEDDEQDDDAEDETYHGRPPKGKSPIKTRSRQPSSGEKRSRTNTAAGKSSGSKKNRRTFQFPDAIEDLPDKYKLPALTVSDTYVETPSGRSSWCYYGVLVQRYTSQTIGFPDYTPTRIDNKLVHARWDPFEYLELIHAAPWEDMWENWVKFLSLFRYSDLGQSMVKGLQWILNFMFVWKREYWERGHWVTMTSIFYFCHDPRFMLLSDDQKLEVINLYLDRKARSNTFFKAKEELMREFQKIEGYGEEIWFEAGSGSFRKILATGFGVTRPKRYRSRNNWKRSPSWSLRVRSGLHRCRITASWKSFRMTFAARCCLRKSARSTFFRDLLQMLHRALRVAEQVNAAAVSRKVAPFF